MSNPYDSARAMIEVIHDKNAFANEYSLFLKRLFGLPVWSPDSSLDGMIPRIPWQQATAAKKQMRETFGSPGIYIFGITEEPMYIGKAEKQTLWTRLSGRYFSGKDKQCQLAVDYEGSIREKGIEGFPQEIRDKYKKNYSGKVRLEHAVEFARRGIDNIWLTIVPVGPDHKESLGVFEECLIIVGNEWNEAKGNPLLLNKLNKHTRKGSLWPPNSKN